MNCKYARIATIACISMLCVQLTGCSSANYVEKPSGTYQTEAVALYGPSGVLSGNPALDDNVGTIGVSSETEQATDDTIQSVLGLVDALANTDNASIKMTVISGDESISYNLKYYDNLSYVAYSNKTIISNESNSYLIYDGKSIAYQAPSDTFSLTTWSNFCKFLQFDAEDYNCSGKKVVNGVAVNYDLFKDESIYTTKDGLLYGVSYKGKDIIFDKVGVTDNTDSFKIPNTYVIEPYEK